LARVKRRSNLAASADGEAAAEELCAYVQRQFRALADPAKAGPMAAYMRTSQPFHGVQHAGVDALAREILTRFPCCDQGSYESHVLALWRLPHREERYLAIRHARQKQFIGPESMPLYERLIREGAWWDLVDETAAHLVGGALRVARKEVEPILDRWLTDSDLWIRRASVLAQLRHGAETKEKQLFRYCLVLAGEQEFFIRKAIGWALREYSKTAPDSVIQFLAANRSRLSPLSLREGAKHLVRQGRLAKGFEKTSA
jgi:3-methyladenine DNA glycosylase AlkD